MRNALLLLLATLAPASAGVRTYPAEPDEPPMHELGFTAGWNSPIGLGARYVLHFTPSQGVEAGAGISLGGGKFGAGYRYVFRAGEMLSPFLAAWWSGSTGLPEVNVNVNADTAQYRVEGAFTVAPRAGLRVRLPPFHLYANTGYHFVVKGGGVEYLSGSTEKRVQNVAEVLGAGGLEASVGLGIFF